MDLIHCINLCFWFYIIYQSAKIFVRMRCLSDLPLKDTVAMTIFLLAGLNICISLIMVTAPNPCDSLHKIADYFIIGMEIFQLLLCHLVIKHIKIRKD